MVEETTTTDVVIISTKTAGGDLEVTITIALSTTNRALGWPADPYMAQGVAVTMGHVLIDLEEINLRTSGDLISLEGGEAGAMQEQGINYKVSKQVSINSKSRL